MNNKEYFTTFIDGLDQTLRLKDFLSAAIPFNITAAQFMHVGYAKPFSQFFMEFGVAEVGIVVPTFEYWNGTTWTALTVVDESEGFSKSGFIYFTRPDDWAATLVAGETLFYVRISPDVDLNAATTLKGLNILLSNDLDLIGVRSNIVSKHNSGNSWIAKHEEARKWIIQQLRNAGNRTVSETQNALSVDGTNSVLYKDLTAFDLLEPFELRQASKFYAISLIYMNELSDAAVEDDKWERSGKRYRDDANESVELFMLKIDKDDDGVEDAGESEGLTRTDLQWV